MMPIELKPNLPRLGALVLGLHYRLQLGLLLHPPSDIGEGGRQARGEGSCQLRWEAPGTVRC